ncbi:MAG: hypothetical protein AB1450_01220 [Pseudomonadota bacterium]
MKYLVALLLGALLIGGVLTAGVHYLFGAGPGYFFAKFIAGPVGLLVSGFVFLVYDSLRPQQAARKDE